MENAKSTDQMFINIWPVVLKIYPLCHAASFHPSKFHGFQIRWQIITYRKVRNCEHASVNEVSISCYDLLLHHTKHWIVHVIELVYWMQQPTRCLLVPVIFLRLFMLWMVIISAFVVPNTGPIHLGSYVSQAGRLSDKKIVVLEIFKIW